MDELNCACGVIEMAVARAEEAKAKVVAILESMVMVCRYEI